MPSGGERSVQRRDGPAERGKAEEMKKNQKIKTFQEQMNIVEKSKKSSKTQKLGKMNKNQKILKKKLL